MFKQLKRFLPPIFLDYLRHYFSDISFSGPYQTWEAAIHDADGYDHENIFDASSRAALQVHDGFAPCERDGVLFDAVEYSWPVIAALMKAAKDSGNTLNVIDFGGGFGSSYYQSRLFTKNIKSMMWVVIEQERFVNFGNQHLSGPDLSFESSFSAVSKKIKPNAILFSAVLHYLAHPSGVVNEAKAIKADYIIVDRSPESSIDQDMIAVQHVKGIYKASYPSWIFKKDKLLELLVPEYSLLADFESNDFQGYLIGKNKITFKGYIFKLNIDVNL